MSRPLRIETVRLLMKFEREELVKRKKSGDELDREPKITVINDYFKERITFFEEQVKSFGPINCARYRQVRSLIPGNAARILVMQKAVDGLR